jgi:hypothetical protein
MVELNTAVDVTGKEGTELSSSSTGCETAFVAVLNLVNYRLKLIIDIDVNRHPIAGGRGQ